MKFNLASFTFPDPISLLDFYPFRIIYQIQVFIKPLCVFSDSEHPLLLFPLFGLRPATFAFSIHHLFVGKADLARRTPINIYFGFISETLFQKLQEDPLRPFIVFRIGGVYLPRPVKRNTKHFYLPTKII